ncbi:putative metallo-hydrolase [Corynebacterium capitovis DSM 44611]|uniref:MBL fold metallo-hydrolase n=1 Tax=Corynebacterium capitovis TaxID=131081 RepID=UPI0003636749|nr:MBL fold metallo-hydrolase [Corynebacterium capitovis]WKD57567.1 putative metallo-hydrolase [Corynebacterium capitovis DSM 44611]
MKISGFPAGPFRTNCYVVINDGDTSRRAVVVDPGLGAAERVNRILVEEGAELVAVLLTHGHIDHTRDAGSFGVPVYIHPADEFMLAAGEGVPERSRLLFDVQSMPPVTQVRHLHDGDTVAVAGLEFTVRHAPGHSPGSVLLSGEGAVFAGDVVFRGTIGRTDLPFSDADLMDESLRGPVWELDDSLALLPGHGPTSTVAQEKATNPYLLAARAGR